MPDAARSALDSFEIITTSGILLWSKKYASVNPNIVNSFISDVLIEERVQPGSDGKWYKKDSYTLKWTSSNDFGLIFIVRRLREIFFPCRTSADAFLGCLPESPTAHMD